MGAQEGVFFPLLHSIWQIDMYIWIHTRKPERDFSSKSLQVVFLILAFTLSLCYFRFLHFSPYKRYKDFHVQSWLLHIFDKVWGVHGDHTEKRTSTKLFAIIASTAVESFNRILIHINTYNINNTQLFWIRIPQYRNGEKQLSANCHKHLTNFKFKSYKPKK